MCLELQILFLVVNFISTDHVRSTRKGKVFTGVCDSIQCGGGVVSIILFVAGRIYPVQVLRGGGRVHPVRILSGEVMEYPNQVTLPLPPS